MVLIIFLLLNFPIVATQTLRLNQQCYYYWGFVPGFCSYCGTGACCRYNFDGGCSTNVGCTTMHCCKHDWVVGYWPEHSTDLWHPCDTTCTRCTQTLCETCVHSDASANGFACECNTGWYPDTDATNCQPCDISWLDWTKTLWNVCAYTGSTVISGTTCACTAGLWFLYPDNNPGSECIKCHDRCMFQQWTATAVHYTQWNGCDSGTLEAQPSSASYKYCIPELPSGATSGTPISISTPLIFSVLLNVPTDTFITTGATAGTITVTQTDPSGFPAKNRGIHFDGTNHAVITLNSLVLYHTFSFHAWLYPFTDGSSRTIFSKDRNDFTTADTSNHITFVLGSDNLPDFTMSKDEDPSVTHSFKGNGTYGQDTWVYAVISGVMNDGYQTSLTFFKNDSSDTTVSNDPIFMIDFAAYPAYLAAHRASTSSWTADYFEGYIYEFHIYNEPYSSGTTHYTTTGWINSICTPQNSLVEIGDYNKYNNGANHCHVSCTNSWVNDQPCYNTCGTGTTEKYCWLCADKEWESCRGYGNSDCISACTASGFASGTTSCTCNPGYVRVGLEYVCQDCYGACATCTGIASTECITCNDKNAHVIASGECQCMDGFFDSDASANQTWSSCSEGYKIENGRWVSIWTDGTYYDSQTTACLPWLAFWATCSDAISCATCADTGFLYTQGKCCGDQHFRDTYLQCQKCAALCFRCTSIPICTYCVDKAVLINNVCEWEEGYHIFEEGCVEDGEAPQLSIGVISANKVQLYFDKQILQQLSTSNTEVVLEGIDPDLYTYSMIEVEPGLTWDIVFDFEDSVELKNTKVDILFREKITDLNGNANDESEYKAQLPDQEASDGSSSDETLDFSEKAIVETTKTTVQTLITAGILSGYVTGDLTSAWGFINTIQILAFIPLMDSQMPELLKTTLVGLLEFELIPNLFEFVLNEDQFVQQEPYDLAKDYGFDNNVFLINWGGILVNAFMILWLIPIMLLLRKCKNAKIADFAKKSVYSYKWCFFLRVWIELHLEVGLAAYFQYMTPYWNNVTMIVNSLLGYLAFVITFLSFPLVLLFMIRNRRLIQERDELFYKIYGSLFEEFQNSMGTVSTLFYSWFFLRRTIYIITLILLRDYVGYQLMMNLIHTLLTLLFLIIYRPYSDQTNNYIQIYSEIVTGIIFSLCACFHFEGARENSEVIKWTVLCLIMSIVVINLVLTFVSQFLLFKAMWKKGCRKRSAKVDSVKQTPFKYTRSISSMNIEETEMSQPYQKPEAIARSPEAVAMSFAKRRIQAHHSTPDTMNFETPYPEASTPIIDQETLTSPELEAADLTVEQQKAQDYRMHKASIKQQVARRVRSSYGAKPDYINFAKMKPEKSVPVLTNESIGSMDMDETMQPQEYQQPQEQPQQDIAEVVASRIKTSYATRPKYINFEPIFHGRSNNG